jgi:murein DD-endopeptidase MepM/ murein hydrolase activator NlpD
MAYPLKDPVVTCKFDQKGNAWRSGRHGGTDFKAARGTEITAIGDGKVVYAGRAGWGPSYGLHVIVQHGDKRVIYAHLSRLNLQGIKDKKLSEGDVLGWSGATGNSFGPHLHLEARVAPYRYDLDAVDPMPLVTGKTDSDEDAPKPVKKASASPVKAKTNETN